MKVPDRKKVRDRERQKALEDEQVLRKLDAILADAGRYMLVRVRKPGFKRPFAALFLRANEKPDKVAKDLDADVLVLAGDCSPETASRLEAERDKLNGVAEVMES